MKRTALLILWLTLLLAACTQEKGEAPPPPVADTTAQHTARIEPEAPYPAPAFALPTLAGDTLRLADLEGQVVVLNFWATWCAPCRAEIPDLNHLHTELAPEGLTVVGVALEESREVVAPFAASFGIAYPVALDDGALAADLGGVWGLPTTFVLDRQGRVVHRVIGLFPTEAMRPTLHTLLAPGA